MKMFLKFGLALSLVISFSVKISAQSFDTSAVVASALIKSIDFKQRIWDKEQVYNLLNDNHVSLLAVESRGIEDVFFFKLNFPEYGIIIKELGGGKMQIHDPYVFSTSVPTYAFDLLTKSLYLLSIDQDLYSFKVLIPQRLQNPATKIYRKKYWFTYLFIEGVDMEYLRKLK